MRDVTYKCAACGREVTTGKDQSVPVCCTKEMEPLPFCTAAPTAETVRNGQGDEPCVDATSPRRRKK